MSVDLGRAVRSVGPRKQPAENPGSELLERIDAKETAAEIRYLGDVKEQPAGTSSPQLGLRIFMRRHYITGRQAAKTCRGQALRSLVAAAICAAGFVDSMVIAAGAAIASAVHAACGFVLRAIKSRMKSKPDQARDDSAQAD